MILSIPTLPGTLLLVLLCAHTNTGEHREHINQDQLWCVDIVEYMVFGSIVGSEYYAPPVKHVPLCTEI